VLEIECVSHYDLNVLIPHSWSHLLAEGGGRLNNNLTHKLCKRPANPTYPGGRRCQKPLGFLRAMFQGKSSSQSPAGSKVGSSWNSARRYQ